MTYLVVREKTSGRSLFVYRPYHILEESVSVNKFLRTSKTLEEINCFSTEFEAKEYVQKRETQEFSAFTASVDFSNLTEECPSEYNHPLLVYIDRRLTICPGFYALSFSDYSRLAPYFFEASGGVEVNERPSYRPYGPKNPIYLTRQGKDLVPFLLEDHSRYIRPEGFHKIFLVLKHYKKVYQGLIDFCGDLIALGAIFIGLSWVWEGYRGELPEPGGEVEL